MKKNTLIKKRKIYCLLITILILFSFKPTLLWANQKNTIKKENIIEKWKKALKTKYSYKYIPDNFDPFMPFITELKPAPILPNTIVYLSEYDLTQVKLVGIIKINNQYIAIIEDPMGRGAFVKVGDYICRTKGKIIKITNCAVYIQENYINFNKKIIKSKPKILYLNDGEEKCLDSH